MQKHVRSVIRIDESKCNGCGLCAEACAEGAIALVDGKAKLVSETYCDGLGACLGECPEGAITIEQREAVEYDEQATRRHLESLGRDPAAAHSPSPAASAPAAHAHGPAGMHGGGCPGSRARTLKRVPKAAAGGERTASRLGQWPVQLALVNPAAAYFQGAELLVTADCVPFAYAEYHRDFLEGKSVVVGCPKLDDLEFYREKLEQLFRASDVRSVTVLRMEVPCCSGIAQATLQALEASGKPVPVRVVTIGIQGEVLDTERFEPDAAGEQAGGCGCG